MKVKKSNIADTYRNFNLSTVANLSSPKLIKYYYKQEI
jgi:hypothetical protein